MLDENKLIKFMYKESEYDERLGSGIIGTLSHIEGKPLASLDDLKQEIPFMECECDHWGDDNSYLIVKEGLYEWRDGDYCRVWGV